MVVYEEFFKGVKLNDFIARRQMSDAAISQIMNMLCAAVKSLHKDFGTPIIHRDIKPENILVKDNNGKLELRLIDFGISRNFDEASAGDTYKYGTVGYAPPEQFGFTQTDERSDIFSLGKVLEFLCNAEN